MAYVLGFFAADGYITVNKRGGQFWCIQITDKELLENIKKVISADHNISIRLPRKLGENIYLDLAEMAGAPVTGDITEGIERLEELMKDDKIMYKIIRKLRPKYDSDKINSVILAFRKAYDLGHFQELEAIFAT